MDRMPVLKHARASWSFRALDALLKDMAKDSYEYKGSVKSIDGEYWLFSPIGWASETKPENSSCK